MGKTYYIYAFLAIRTWLHLFIKPSLIAIPCLDKNITKRVYNFHKATHCIQSKTSFFMYIQYIKPNEPDNQE